MERVSEIGGLLELGNDSVNVVVAVSTCTSVSQIVRDSDAATGIPVFPSKTPPSPTSNTIFVLSVSTKP